MHSIGDPGDRSVTREEAWRAAVEEKFPKSEEKVEATEKGLGAMEKYIEEKVDAMRKLKDEELEQYKKESERQKRLEMAGEKGKKGAGGERKVTLKKKGTRAAAAQPPPE